MRIGAERELRRLRFLLGMGILLMLSASAIGAQSLGRVDRQRGLTMLKQIRADIERHYFDSAYKGVDIASHFAAAEERIRSAQSLPELFATIANALLELDDSHTFYIPPAVTVDVNYGWSAQMFGDSCFVTEVDHGSDAEKQGVEVGDQVVSINGYTPTRQNFWKLLYVYHLLRPQPGLRVAVRSPGEAPRQLDLAARVIQRKKVHDLTGQDGGTDIRRLIRGAEELARRERSEYHTLGDGVLLWKLAVFDEGKVKDGLKRLQKARSLVLDLRGNGGGTEKSLLLLLGSLFTDDFAIGTLRRRADTERLVARGGGDRAFTGPLLVLVDSESGSASEVLARSVQRSGRGRVLGDRTMGAVMRSRTYVHRVGAETVVFYAASVTDADLVLDGDERLEGVGVTPDEELRPSSVALNGARDPVLARAATLFGVPLTPTEAGSLYRRR